MLRDAAAPDHGMAMGLDPLALTEIYELVRRRTPPVRLALGMLAVVPELLCVPILRRETQPSRLRFKRFPVERNRRTVEQRPEE